MNIKAIVLLILVISSTYSVQLRRSNFDRYSRLQKLSEQSKSAKTLIDSILLNLSSGGQVEDVIKFVKEALAHTVNQKKELKVQSEVELDALDTQIAGLNNDLRDMNSELVLTNQNIAYLKKDIAALELQIENLLFELTALQEREDRINRARQNDLQAFASRQLRDTNALTALDQIIPALQQLQNQGEAFIQKSYQQVKDALKSIPYGSSLQALIQVSKKFNKAQLTTVIEKLQGIREAIAASKFSDEQGENASKLRYDYLIAEIEELRKEKQSALSNARSSKTSKEQELHLAEARKSSLESNIESTTVLRDATVQIREDTAANYQRRLEEADKTIEALESVLKILTENESQLQSREEKSDSLNSNLGDD